VMRHRLVPTFHAEAEGVTVDHIVKHLLDNTKRPTGKVM
jgi:MoxR-like ATPase